MQFDFGNLESPLSGTVFINGNLEPWRDALHSSHKGGTRPSYAVEGMMWVNDTTNPWVLNMFDGSNDIAIGTFDTTTNVFTPSGVSQAAEDISYDNDDSGLSATNVQDAIDEAVSDFSDFEGRVAGFATAAQGALADTALQSTSNILGISSPVNTTSGVFADLTGIPSGVNRVTLVLNGVSSSGTNFFIFRLITAGGVQSTGYASYASGLSGTSVASAAYTDGLGSYFGNAAAAWFGQLVLTRVPSTNVWVLSGTMMNASSPANVIMSGSKDLGAALTGIRITTVGGTDTLDAGSAYLIYEK